MDLAIYEPMIKATARRFAATPSEIDDLAQEGRIAAWKALGRNPIDPKPYVRRAVEYGIIQRLQHNGRIKRNPSGGMSYLSQQISEEDDRVLENLIGEERLPTGREFVEGVKEELRQKYGRHFLKGLQEKERFPKVTASKIIRTVIEDVEQIPFEQIPERVNSDFFSDRGLEPLIKIFYNGSPYMAVNEAYSKAILAWEWSRVPVNYWQGPFRMKRASDALTWFVKKRKIKTIEDCGRIIGEDFVDEGLGGMLRQIFNEGTYIALKTQFPELRPWHMRHAPAGTFDNEENRKDALNDYLIAQGSKIIQNLSPEETYDQISLRKFLTKKSVMDFGLCTLLNRYGRSVYRMFSENFPEQILPWTIKNAKSVWKDNPRETAINAVKWMLEDYLKLEGEEIPVYATKELFWRLRFSGIMTNKKIGFHSSPFEAVNAVYPNVYSLDDFRRGKTSVMIDLEGKSVA
ncbi:MAG: sigma-70 family RNA polymerase sigma factor [Nanoarchaeota archaeon]|nr:sigma-70 family RNA polymerase sigma factor [Nanoarchaeota archaeon]